MGRLREQISRGPVLSDHGPDASASTVSVRKDVLEPAARLCAAARVLARHAAALNPGESDKLLAQIDEAAEVLQDGVTTLVRREVA